MRRSTITLLTLMSLALSSFMSSYFVVPQRAGAEVPITTRILLGLQTIDRLLMGNGTLNVVRHSDGDIRLGQLSFFGAAIAYQGRRNDAEVSAYNFAFRNSSFTTLPAFDSAFYETFYNRMNQDFQRTTGLDIDSCIDPRSDSGSTGNGLPLKLSTLCRMQPVSGPARSAMIGVIYPHDNNVPVAHPELTCREEIALWRSFAGFEGFQLAFCVIVDRPYVDAGEQNGLWMDIIVFEVDGKRLFTRQGSNRNVSPISVW